VLDQVRAPRFVACDTMNFWIGSKRDSLVKTLRRVDLLFVNDAEARQLSGEHSIVKAARRILALGPRALVVKRGEYGALYFSGSEVFAASAYPVPDVFDPTGAGDCFAGGFMGYLARSGEESSATMRRAVVVGSVLASFAVEQFSLDRLRVLTADEIRGRYAEARRLAHFDDLEADVLEADR
jgi:sugar/nucleoside kinase (ribokinase family)